jgi:hypothetical protein
MEKRGAVVASERFLAVAENSCFDHATLTVVDRQSGKVSVLPGTLAMAFTPSGLLGIGSEPDDLVDLDRMQYVAEIPGRSATSSSDSSGDIAWSPDYRYASHGFAGGHGGPCLGAG